jgi:hypothetical protein
MQHLGLSFPPIGAPPETPPMLITAVAAPSSPVDIFQASPCGEQDDLVLFSFLCTQHQLHELAGEADPPPSDAGHRGCPSFPLTP